jgi:carbonic anhydrase/acetyltransferase-like protein (isoleucine patch superfamily)
MNEAGGRSILPFRDMLPADAFLWAAFRDDTELTDRLTRITQERYGGHRGSYGTVGDRSVIKSCTIIKDVAIGDHAYIKGANKLKNLTILSSGDEPTQIGEGVELVNGIVGHGCRIFYGSKAVRFVMGRNCNLKYGARLVHSVMGDNSTVSCCEILNNLIFPMHEQHHNNSFLIASLVQGMSNMAAAATIGSNHNSRANDGEIRAKRGFWPGLAVSLKHSSCFASFVLIAKGEYPAELNIPLPFSLLSNNTYKNRLELMPAYYWVHNLYALERNSWKVRRRDQRVIKAQHIETDYLAPDTAEEIIVAIATLEAWLDEEGLSPDDALGENLIPCRHLEHSKRGQVILRPREGIAAYRQMLRWYAVRTLVLFMDERPDLSYDGMVELLGAGTPTRRVRDWVNMGGQIVPAFRVDGLRADIGEGRLETWDAIHQVYARWRDEYPMDKARHAWAVFSMLNDRPSGEALTGSPLLKQELATSLEIRRLISDKVYETREKDFRNAFKKATFRNAREMELVLCPTDEDPFLSHAGEEERAYWEMVARVMARL